MRSARGLTLTETILSTFLVSLVMMAIFQLIPGSALAIQRAECKLQANVLLDAALDSQLAKGFQAQVEQQTYGDLVLPDHVNRTITYHTTLSVFEVSGHSPARLRGVRCTVEWNFGEQDFRLVREAWLSAVRGGS